MFNWLRKRNFENKYLNNGRAFVKIKESEFSIDSSFLFEQSNDSDANHTVVELFKEGVKLSLLKNKNHFESQSMYLAMINNNQINALPEPKVSVSYNDFVCEEIASVFAKEFISKYPTLASFELRSISHFIKGIIPIGEIKQTDSNVTPEDYRIEMMNDFYYDMEKIASHFDIQISLNDSFEYELNKTYFENFNSYVSLSNVLDWIEEHKCILVLSNGDSIEVSLKGIIDRTIFDSITLKTKNNLYANIVFNSISENKILFSLNTYDTIIKDHVDFKQLF